MTRCKYNPSCIRSLTHYSVFFFFLMIRPPPRSTLFPSTPLSRSSPADDFCIWPPALLRCRQRLGSQGHKPIRHGRCASSSASPLAARLTSLRTNGLAVLPSELLPMLLGGASLVSELLDDNDADRARLTPRELEVLAAMADGVSNKAIARRLGISFHTAKFHVAAILAKLNADSRTEAVARAAQLGLVML